MVSEAPPGAISDGHFDFGVGGLRQSAAILAYERRLTQKRWKRMLLNESANRDAGCGSGEVGGWSGLW